ncbi:MAG: IPT/TIG domain-containing protein [Deltaproteobacteria bacterium]
MTHTHVRHSLACLVCMLVMLGGGCDRRDASTTVGDAGPVPSDSGSRLALRGVDPTHGPFDRTTPAVLEGAGFGEGATVTVDGVPITTAVVRSPGRITVDMPPHEPGVVPVSVSDRGSTVTLERAFTYDALSVMPAEGSTRGGLRVVVRVSGQTFWPGDQITFDGLPCTDLEILEADRARCRTPASEEPGAVAVRLVRAEAGLVVAPEAFRYRASTAVGGIGGGPIAGELRVTVQSWRGEVPDALVQVVTPGGTLEARADDEGVAVLTDPRLSGPVTVHAGHPCFGVTSLVEVNARSLVTALPFWSPDDPSCPEPPSGGGFSPTLLYGTFRGVAQFPSREEFGPPGPVWNGVPMPRPGEVRVLYAGYHPPYSTYWRWARFFEEDYDPSVQGFPFEGLAPSGGTRLRAVAGIEPVGNDTLDRGLPNDQFMPYVLGDSAPGLVPPAAPSERVAVPVRTLLDRKVEVGVLGSGQARLNVRTSFGVPFPDGFQSFTDVAPAAFDVLRMPGDADFWASHEVIFSAGVESSDGTGSGATAWMTGYVPAFSLDTPPPITLVRPEARIPWDEAIELRTDGAYDLFRISVSGPRPWLILARGTVRSIAPIPSDDRALSLPAGDYQVLLYGDLNDAFDFDAFDFEVLRDEIGIGAPTRTPAGITVLRSAFTQRYPVLLR